MKHFATITVIGKDKTGVIARVTHFLFEQRANIEALEEQVTRGQFSMTLQASWKKDHWDAASLAAGLQDLGRVLHMEVKFRAVEPNRPQRAAIMATKEPHCLEGLLAAFKSGSLKAEPALVLARFMRILSPNFVWRFKNKIINIHPSLLPSFPGAQAYRQAYERGVKIIGVTAHFVTMHLDEGPIIAQGSFPVNPNMTMKEIVARGQQLETRVLVKAVRLYLSKRLDVYWGIVKQI